MDPRLEPSFFESSSLPKVIVTFGAWIPVTEKMRNKASKTSKCSNLIEPLKLS